MNSTESALQERIKELTCLYEVSSIIVNADVENIENTLKAIAFSLKKAFSYPKETDIIILVNTILIKTNQVFDGHIKLRADIVVFNKLAGTISAYLNQSKFSKKDFLNEEQLLLNSIALKLGNLFERIEIRKNEISLKRQMEHADRLNILGELTAGIAHELNTPLANILGYAELLKDHLNNNNQSTADLEKIIQNTIFSREVVKKLMFFACEMPQEMTRVNIIPSIKDAIDLLDTTFRKQQVKYIVKIEEEALWLRADIIQLTQIIFNLIINAIYFSPKNGLVTISTFQTDTDVILKISDEGPGIAREALEKIFQPFFTTKPIGEGSGLGLSVVHGIISSHKGTIIAKNNSVKGCTFTVTLPKQL
ncbi:histidine kinase [Pseudalgibacter alginicilyticus]|uniref:histidine kinase n=1 Tax=Pseudalgibacter alginicilyticus TaxID=1736674 RepID=A0A0P0D7Q7_9FLAO|nr:HAMP domain-containing sensor histidine kinase [Pseudalgibacter alginicilyticus]ALJ04755.1 histidine kinase [Pseudalgibacter alginicilyticus]